MVEIAKALARRPRILILDEATSALTAADVTRVFDVLKRLRAEGLALIYISHRMNEIAELADRCTVFRNGRNVASYDAGTQTDDEVVEMMIGREYRHAFPPLPGVAPTAPPLLEARGLRWSDRLHDISFSLGPAKWSASAGSTARASASCCWRFFGVLRGVAGEIRVGGKPVAIGSPRAAASERIGMALIPEDRKTEGLMLPMTVRENLSFAALDRVSHAGVIDRAAEETLIDEMVQLLAIRTAGLDIPVAALSGGNQQKVVIAKWLMRQPRIILLERPDPRHRRRHQAGTLPAAAQAGREGAAILFYSTDYDELIGCCDRVWCSTTAASAASSTARG